MRAQQLRFVGASDGTSAEVRRTLAQVRAELDIPTSFPSQVLREARRTAEEAGAQDEARGAPAVPGPRTDRRDVPFVTLDPSGSQDLDQAFHLAADGDGHVLHYAIADVAAFVVPDGAVDAEARRRGLTLYGVDERTPLHPTVLSEGAASLLPGVDRRAALWTVQLDADGEIVGAHVERAVVRSRRQLSYDELQAVLDDPVPAVRAARDERAGTPGTPDLRTVAELLRTVGTRRLERERARGGVSLDVPEQVVVTHDDGTTTLEFRSVLPVESWNAQLSLLTGIAAAHLMIGAGTGVLRTLPEAQPADVDRLRVRALALGVVWPEGATYAEVLAGLDPRDPRTAAFRTAATSLFRGASYEVLGAAPPAGRPARNGHVEAPSRHAALATYYAHVTAPLRRLVDRFGTEVCLAVCAGEPVPKWVLDALPALPAQMASAIRRDGQYQRAGLDVVEAALLTGHEGETFPATAIEPEVVQLLAPAVKARIKGADLEVGAPVTVRVDSASVAERSVRLSVVAG